MSYRKLLVTNLTKSLQGRYSPTHRHASLRCAAFVPYQHRHRSKSVSTPPDKVEERSLTETEALLHKSLQRCRNIYGLIENSTKDFEHEVKLIERIFTKYNDLAAKKGHQVHEIMQKMSDVVTMRSSLKDRKEEQAPDPPAQLDEKAWYDLHEFTARPPIPVEKPLYKVFVEAMEQKPESVQTQSAEYKVDEKYPDPDDVDILQSGKQRTSNPEGIKKQRSSTALARRKLSTVNSAPATVAATTESTNVSTLKNEETALAVPVPHVKALKVKPTFSVKQKYASPSKLQKGLSKANRSNLYAPKKASATEKLLNKIRGESGDKEESVKPPNSREDIHSDGRGKKGTAGISESGSNIVSKNGSGVLDYNRIDCHQRFASTSSCPMTTVYTIQTSCDLPPRLTEALLETTGCEPIQTSYDLPPKLTEARCEIPKLSKSAISPTKKPPCKKLSTRLSKKPTVCRQHGSSGISVKQYSAKRVVPKSKSTESVDKLETQARAPLKKVSVKHDAKKKPIAQSSAARNDSTVAVNLNKMQTYASTNATSKHFICTTNRFIPSLLQLQMFNPNPVQANFIVPEIPKHKSGKSPCTTSPIRTVTKKIKVLPPDDTFAVKKVKNKLTANSVKKTCPVGTRRKFHVVRPTITPFMENYDDLKINEVSMAGAVSLLEIQQARQARIMKNLEQKLI